ncbi:MAG: penicillin-binding protein [Candidatus Pelagibacter sp.]|nr:penicillin-binding protein [Candidatus Pelagibacter sp.]OUV97856.1 MAG: penicillin-binding protein [Candidatus Pelagibacter sp. TMED142]
MDAKGITRAVFKNINNILTGSRLEGASTITQQVAKNFLLTSDVSLARKIKEAILAFRIEKSLSKQRILELYLNEIYLGERAYGIASASMIYFDKSVSEIDIAEAALLASLPKAPSKYNPYKRNNLAIKRKDWVLNRMYDNKFIDKTTLIKEKKRKILLKKKKITLFENSLFFSEEVRKKLFDKYGEDNLYKGGMYVKTSLNNKIQLISINSLIKNLESYDKRHGWRGPYLENIDLKKFENLILKEKGNYRNKQLALVTNVEDRVINIFTDNKIDTNIAFNNFKWARRYISADARGPNIKYANEIVKKGDVIFVSINKNNEYKLDQIPNVNGGVIVMNPWNGRVYSLVGGYSFDLNQFNRVTQAMRQPGSAFKPFVYAVALENGFRPNDLILDAPFVLDQNKGEFKWKPSNYGKKFYGLNTFRSGIEKSKNLTTVRIAQNVGLKKINLISKKLNIYTDPIQILSYSLGSGETNLINLSSAYASFVNGGRIVNPTLIDHIQDQNGKTIYKNKKIFCDGCEKDFLKNSPPKINYKFGQVFSDATAFQMVNILKGVVERGTAKKIRNLNLEVGGKTGTTNDNFDAWFIGFTPNVLIGVYVGFDEPATLGKLETGSKAALPIFRDIISQLKTNTNRPFFKVPQSIKLEKIDIITGDITKKNSRNVIIEGFKINNMTKKSNNYSPLYNGIY